MSFDEWLTDLKDHKTFAYLVSQFCGGKVIMNKILLFIIVFSQILVCLAACSPITGDESMKYDNEISYTNLINQKYSPEKIEAFKKEIETNTNSPMTFSKLNTKFKIQCTRKTFQGYYSILKQNDESIVFVFINHDLEIIRLLKVHGFKSKSDFDFIVPKETKKSAIIALDSNAISYPISSFDVTGHILKDGLLIVRYNRIVDGMLLNDSVVDSVEFIDNAESSKVTDDFWVKNTPYILPIDKSS
jgi:hypothetical protein